MNISWLKLDVNILKNEKIDLLRSYPDGDSLFVLWIGLLCMAMKSDIPGHILICKGSPYSVEDLSNLLNISKKTVQMGLELFARFGMIKLGDFNEIEVTNFQEKQSIDKIEHQKDLNRKRVQKYRDKQKQLECNDVTENVTLRNEQIRLDKIRVDKKRIDKEIKYPTSLNNSLFINKYGEWEQFRKELKKPLTPTSIKQQLKLLSKYSIQDAIYIIDKSIRNGYQGLFEPSKQELDKNKKHDKVERKPMQKANMVYAQDNK